MEDFNNLMIGLLIIVVSVFSYGIYCVLHNKFECVFLSVLIFFLLIPLVIKARRGILNHYMSVELTKNGIVVKRTTSEELIGWDEIEEVGVRIHKENEMSWRVLYFSKNKLPIPKKLFCGSLFLNSTQNGVYYAVCPTKLPKELAYISLGKNDGIKWIDIRSHQIHSLDLMTYERLSNLHERNLAYYSIGARVFFSCVLSLAMTNSENGISSILILLLLFISVCLITITNRIILKWVNIVSI